jgi:small subunit ribosomal protein S20
VSKLLSWRGLEVISSLTRTAPTRYKPPAFLFSAFTKGSERDSEKTQFMANHKSAIKRNRQSQSRRAINRSNTQRLRTQLKKMKLAIGANNKDDVQKLLAPTLSLIDKSIQKGVLHKNAASRQKSRLMHGVNKLLAVQASA